MSTQLQNFVIHRYSCDVLSGPQLDTTEIARALTEEAADKLVLVNNIKSIIDFYATSGLKDS